MTSLDAAISQNEDLMARLKVTLRRLSVVEEECQSLEKDQRQAQQLMVAMQDQLSVWKEKERLWSLKKNQLEKDVQDLRAQTPDAQSLMKQLSRLQRFQTYYSQKIKPAFLELKEFCNRLGRELKSTRRELEVQNKHIEGFQRSQKILEDRLALVEYQKNQEIEQAQDAYSRKLQTLSQEILSLRISNEHLVKETQKLPDLLNQQDHLQNQVIVLRRERDQLLQQQIVAQQNQEQEHQALKQDITRKQVLIDDLKLKIAHHESQHRTSESQIKDLSHQLEALRILWAQKNDEAQKLTLALRNLEKLNANLSRQLSVQPGSAAQPYSQS